MIRTKGRVSQEASGPVPRWIAGGIDLLVTSLLWVYFTLGFVFLAGPFYLLGAVLWRGRYAYFQALNHYFYRGFFLLCRLLIPMHTWHIDPAIRGVRSAVIVCNHVSYIDSILLISLFRRHTTIVKNRLFRIPILGWVLTLSGYLPASTGGRGADTLADRLAGMPSHLAAGGNLIVFPEGTRSRDGAIGAFNAGAFKIARLCRAPLTILFVRNTEKLFTPGRFLFNTCTPNTISLEMVGQWMPAYERSGFSLIETMARVRALMVAGTENT